MSSTPEFAKCDTKKPDGFYVQFERVILDDHCCDKPDERDCGFWPSRDPKSAGYVGECTDEEFREHFDKARERMEAFESGDWNYVGVRARAKCLVVRDNVGTYVNLDSPGVWGIESDAGDYLDEVYREEIEEVKHMIEAMREPVYEESPKLTHYAMN